VSAPSGDGSRQWVIHRDQLVDDDGHVRVSRADVQLPDGTEFTQYVFRLRRCAMLAIFDEPGDSILLLRRHRFIIDRWVWELPGGYVDEGEDGAAAAAREAQEETGWQPGSPQFVLSFQPMIGTADAPQDLYASRGAELAGVPASDEAAEVRWVALSEAAAMISSGQIAGAATILAVWHGLMLQAAARPAAR
jgi:8-oxo-dGTP pyrophosphatase MutT (NUDIX family)